MSTNNEAKTTAQVRYTRDQWGALNVWIGDGANRTKLGRAWVAVRQILSELEAGNVDDHRAPAWERGAAFHRRRGGTAVNVSIYGVDIVDGQSLGVVQVREWRKRQSWDFARIRKSYFLVGRNEGTGQPFAHPIESRTVHAAIKHDTSPDSPVTAARAWIFAVPIDKLPTILRHGDVAAIPIRALPNGAREVISGTHASITVIDAHVLEAAEIVMIGERLYARDPLLHHRKGQHADVKGVGWHRIQVGLRASSWQFARPTSD